MRGGNGGPRLRRTCAPVAKPVGEMETGGGGGLWPAPTLAHAPAQPGGVLGRAQPGNSAVRALPSDAWFSGPLPAPDLLPSHCCGTDTAKRAHLEQRLSQPGAALVRQFGPCWAPPRLPAAPPAQAAA